MNPPPPSAHSQQRPSRAVAFPRSTSTISHLREVLGDEAYESLARIGENMTNAAMADYAFEQIDRAAELNCPPVE